VSAPLIAVDDLARLLSAADVFVNKGDYPSWDDLSTTPGYGRDEYRKAARYILRRCQVAPWTSAEQTGKDTHPGESTQPEPLAVRWDRTVIHPDADPTDDTIVCCIADTGQPVALFLDDEHREALGLALVDPNPEDATAEDDGAEPDFFQPGHTYAHAHAHYRFHCLYLVPHPVTGEVQAWGWFGKDSAPGRRHISFGPGQWAARTWDDITTGGADHA
jgi:hypothetical protein